MCKLRNTIDGAVSAIKIFITWVTKALVPEHSASSVLNRKDRDFQEWRIDIAGVDVIVSVDVYVAVFVDIAMPKRRYSWC